MSQPSVAHPAYQPHSGPTLVEDPALQSPAKQSAFRTKPCRYYLAGYCRSGSACQFKHVLESEIQGFPDGDELKQKASNEAFQQRGVPAGNDRIRPSITIPLASYPVYPAHMYSPAWSGQAAHNASPVLSHSPVPFNVVNGAMHHAAHMHGAFGPSSPADLQSPGYNELITPLEDLSLSEPFIRRPSHPVITPTLAHNSYTPVVSPTSGYPMYPYVDRFGTPTTKTSGRHHSRQSSTSKKLIASYKTKPCKFWGQDGTCPNGAKCTFVHDEPITPNVTSTSSDGESSDLGSPTCATPHDLPTRPLSVIEEKKKQGFYPISWRVIGGGVMMSGKREACRAYLAGQCGNAEDCPFSHDVESDDSGSYPSETYSNETSPDAEYLALPQVVVDLDGKAPTEQESNTKRKGGRPLSICVPPAQKFLPLTEPSKSALPNAVPSIYRTEEEYDDIEEPVKSASKHRRTKSMTTPTTPGSSHLDASDANYQ